MKLKKLIKFFILFSSLIVFIIALINKCINMLATKKNLSHQKEGNYFDWRFGRIFYTKKGTGTPILLIHDLDLCSSSEEWSKLVANLTQNHTVYLLDLLGCGLSDKPYLTYTNYLYVQLVTDFIKNVIQHKTDILVNGSSCSFVILACHNDTELFDKIMLINPVNINKLKQIPGKKQKLLKIFIDFPIFGTLIYNILFCKENIKDLLLSQYFAKQVLSVSDINYAYEISHLQNGGAKYLFASIKSNYTNATIIHALKEINNSMFILGGSEETEISDTIEQYLCYNPSIENALIPTTKHFPHREDPESVFDQINIFF